MFKIIQGLKLFSKRVALAQTYIILTIIYIAIVPIFACLLFLTSKKRYGRTGWKKWVLRTDLINDLKKQF